jgi:hypothetical protein
LLARALFHADPDDLDWWQSLVVLTQRHRDAAGWATARLAHPDVPVRRFAAEALRFAGNGGEQPDERAAAALAARLPAEDDTDVLKELMLAFAVHRYFPPPLVELRPFATHPDPEIRATVAGHLYDPGSLSVLLAMADDPVPEVRAHALRTLVEAVTEIRDEAEYQQAAPDIQAAFIAHRIERDTRVRLEALAGLSLNGDRAAWAELHEIDDPDERIGRITIQYNRKFNVRG